MLDYTGKFREGTNYKLSFAIEVDWLLAVEMVLPDRMKAIDDLLEAYVRQTGETPDPVQVNRLTNFILREDLNNRNSDKVTNTDYPFLSRGQFRQRNRREIPCNLAGATGDIRYKLNGRKKSSYNKQG